MQPSACYGGVQGGKGSDGNHNFELAAHSVRKLPLNYWMLKHYSSSTNRGLTTIILSNCTTLHPDELGFKAEDLSPEKKKKYNYDPNQNLNCIIRTQDRKEYNEGYDQNSHMITEEL